MKRQCKPCRDETHHLTIFSMEHYIQFFTFSFVENKHQMFNISPKVVEIKTKIKLCFLSKHYYAFWPFPVYMCFENHKKTKIESMFLKQKTFKRVEFFNCSKNFTSLKFVLGIWRKKSIIVRYLEIFSILQHCNSKRGLKFPTKLLYESCRLVQQISV